MIIAAFFFTWFITLAAAFYIGRFSVWFEIGWNFGKIAQERNIPVAEVVKEFKKQVLDK